MSQTLELETKSVKDLLIHYATPGIIAMIATSLYNIVDSIFIGHFCGPLALGGLTVAKPFMDICAAFGSFVGIGSSTLLSIKLGQKDYFAANKILGNVITLNIIISLLVTFCGLFFLRSILYLFGASNNTIDYAHDYMQIILFGNILTHLYFGLNNVLRSMGHPNLSMKATIFAVIINVILDPIFIVYFDMGVRGVAIATIFSQMLSVIWQVSIFFNEAEIIHFQRGIWKPIKKLVQSIFFIGLAPLLMNLAHCAVIVIINRQLYRFGGDMSIASYGVVNRFIFIFSMVVMGLNQGMQPIVGYNFGAGKYDRVLKCFKLTCFCATIIMGFVFVFGELLPRYMISVFTHDATLIENTILPMRIICSTMLLVGFQIITVQFFTALGEATKAIFLSLTRQVLFLIPLVLFLPILTEKIDFIGTNLGVWLAIPVSDFLSASIVALMLFFELQKMEKSV